MVGIRNEELGVGMEIQRGEEAAVGLTRGRSSSIDGRVGVDGVITCCLTIAGSEMYRGVKKLGLPVLSSKKYIYFFLVCQKKIFVGIHFLWMFVIRFPTNTEWCVGVYKTKNDAWYSYDYNNKQWEV